MIHAEPNAAPRSPVRAALPPLLLGNLLNLPVDSTEADAGAFGGAGSMKLPIFVGSGSADQSGAPACSRRAFLRAN